MTIIYQSSPYPRALEIVGPGLKQEVVEALTEKLLAMDASLDNGVLGRYEKTTGFSPITADIYAQLKQVYQYSLQWEK